MRSNPWKDITQRELTVRLTPAQGAIRVEYLRNGRLMNAQPKDQARLGEACQDARAALQSGERDRLERALTGLARVTLGLELYQLLFPDPDAASEVFRELSGSTARRVYAQRLSVRLRILTDDRTLQALPWSLTCAPEGTSQLATGPRPWTFELTSSLRGDAVGRLQPPARLLLICPESAEAPHFPRHLQDRLAQDDPSYESAVFFRTVRTREALIAARDWQPQVVVFLGHAREYNGAPLLCFDEDDTLDAIWLRTRMPKTVQLLVLTGCWTGAGGPAGLGPQLGDVAPAVLVGMTRLSTEHAQALTRHWLTRILFDGLTPAQAIHTWPDDVDLATHHGSTYALHTRYEAWQAPDHSGRPHRVYSSPVSHRLDRFHQRAIFRTRVDAFLGTDARVLATVGIAPGDEDARPELLSELLREDLREERGDRLVFTEVAVRFPNVKKHLRGALEDAVRLALQAGSAHLPPFIRAAGPRPRPQSAGDACLWLDFGHLGGASGNPLTMARIDAWLEMCALLLEPNTPSTLKIITFITADTPDYEEIKFAVRRFRSRVHPIKVVPIALGVLEHVDRDELDEFMYTRGATQCLPGLREAATDKLFDACRIPGTRPARANYRCLVEAIEAAEEMGWSAFVGEPTEPEHDPHKPL